ncbi:MAG: hypothetical protein IID36_14545 [Planctomycetes bacterium]|nr:hypothetical protein [Planctomycetota bacterium]
MASVSTDTGGAASTPEGDTATSVRKAGGAMASLSTDADGPTSAAVEKRKAARRAGRTTLVGKGIQRLTTADAKTRAVGGKGEAAKVERSRSADKRDTKKDEHVEGAAPGQPPVSRDSAKPVAPEDKLVTLVIEWVAPPASSPAKVRSSKTAGSAHKTRKAKPPEKKPATR